MTIINGRTQPQQQAQQHQHNNNNYTGYALMDLLSYTVASSAESVDL